MSIPPPRPATPPAEREDHGALGGVTEDGSAPEPVLVERVRVVTAHQNVRCARCLEGLEPVFADRVEDGVWESLQAAGALSLEVSGGYGMYVDPMGWDRAGSDSVLLTCEECTTWLRSELPGLDLVLRRLAER